MSELTINEMESETRQIKANKLTMLVKHIIDVLWYLTIAVLIIWPIGVMIIGLNIPDDPQDRHTDINFYLSFKVYPEELGKVTESHSKLSETIQGNGKIKLNNTKSHLAWYLSNAVDEIMGIISLFGFVYMRKLFANLAEGKVFDKDNPVYIQKVAYVFIGWNLISPVLVYFAGMAILNDVGQHATSIQLVPMIDLGVGGIFTGLAFLVLAGVMKEAASIYQEQSLTI
jgi:hypothetical protein